MVHLQLKRVLMLLLPLRSLCGNPIIANDGVADPHIHPFGDTFYLYSTHDYSPNNTGFRMDNWRVFSSPDLVSWSLVSVLNPQDTPAPPAAYHECWATDAAVRNGTYYFYLSIGSDQVAVVSSPFPFGPWQDTLGRPMLNTSLGQALGTTIRDPCVFYDVGTDSHFIIFGVYTYFIARLAPDMTSLAEYPRLVTVINPLGPYGNKTDDKPFIHKEGAFYYLSWGCFYGMSDSVYGPYTYAGSVISTAAIADDFKMNDTGGEWYSHQDYADRHGSFWQAGGQWYYAANDRSHSTDLAHRDVYRDTV